jgi:bifunctional non-homologous end joining protein LigD
VFEVKFDGYRMLARIEKGKVRLITRNNNDWTDKLRRCKKEIERIGLPDGWYDGEIVVHDPTAAEFRPAAARLRRQRQGRHHLFPVRRALPRRLRPAQRRPGRCGARCSKGRSSRPRPSDMVRFSDVFGTDPEGWWRPPARSAWKA